MKLILALGNPDARYDATRHNVGFWAVDEYVQAKGLGFTKAPKFKAEIAEFSESGEKIILAKPQTYYNLVGVSFRAIIDFYKIAPEDVLVVSDDLALPLGTVRTRVGGSDAGSNGIKSLIAHGGEATHRLRIGIANEKAELIDKADFVLSKFNKEEAETLREIASKIAEIIDEFIAGSHEPTTHHHS